MTVVRLAIVGNRSHQATAWKVFNVCCLLAKRHSKPNGAISDEGRITILNRILKAHIDKQSRLIWLAKKKKCNNRDKCPTQYHHLPSSNAPGTGENKEHDYS